MQMNPGVLYGGPDPADIMKGTRSMGELCWKMFTEFSDRIVLINGHTGETVKSHELRDRSRQVAEALRRIGIGSSDTVGLCAENRLEFAYIMFGTIMVGARLTLLNPTYNRDELIHAVNLSTPKIMFVGPAAVQTLNSVAVECSFIRHIVHIGDQCTIGPNSFEGLMAADGGLIGNTEFTFEPQDINSHVLFILYSSGTTGQPKGVQLTQRNSIWAVARMNHFNGLHVSVDDNPNPIHLSVLPWFHTYGCHSLMQAAMSGGTMVFLSRFDPHSYLGAIQRYQISSISVAPPLMVFLAKSTLVDQYDLSSIRRIGCGAAPLPKHLEAAVFKRLGAPSIRQGYGMTEGTLCFTRQSDHFCTTGSVGILLPGLYGRVVDPETGRVLGAGQEGELHFRECSMIGYIGNDKATAEIIGSDGWLRTGDIGYYDERGEWFVVDRLKELIKYKGFQVAPAEIEGLLLKHAQIADAGVIGIADETAGELPMAFVVRQPNMVLSEKEVIDYVAGRMSTAKHLRGGVRFVAAIPKNLSGKILRRELRSIGARALASKL